MKTADMSITTDQVDLITFHAARENQLPNLYFDALTEKVSAEVSLQSQESFLNDTTLQRFLAVKRQIWKRVEQIRRSGGAI